MSEHVEYRATRDARSSKHEQAKERDFGWRQNADPCRADDVVLHNLRTWFLND